MESPRPYLEDDLSCPVCQNIFENPVMLTCSHSVCQDCLTIFWEGKGVRKCPVCRKKAPLDRAPLLNLVLKNVCEAFQEERNKGILLCSQHQRKLELYCTVDKEPVCLVCRDSEKHKHHNFSSVSELAAGLREKIREGLQDQRENMKGIQNFKVDCDKMEEFMKRQVPLTEQNMKGEFEKLHHFLQEQEAVRIAELKEEEKQRAMMVNVKLEDAAKDVRELTQRIRETEEDLAADDASFVLNYERTLQRSKYVQAVGQLNCGDLVDVVKHLGNLKFNVWEKMQEVINYTPVVLDPNTAHGSLTVSADLTSVVRSKELQSMPPNPDRFLHMQAVLGQELSSGRHCWDVDVRDADYWILGIVRVECLGFVCENFSHGGLYYLAKEKYWDFACAASPQHATLRVKEKPNCVRMLLDLDRGKLTFSDAERKINLRTLSVPANDLVHPIFWPLAENATLRVLPVTPTVSVQKVPGLKKSNPKKPAKGVQQQGEGLIPFPFPFPFPMANGWY